MRAPRVVVFGARSGAPRKCAYKFIFTPFKTVYVNITHSIQDIISSLLPMFGINIWKNFRLSIFPPHPHKSRRSRSLACTSLSAGNHALKTISLTLRRNILRLVPISGHDMNTRTVEINFQDTPPLK